MAVPNIFGSATSAIPLSQLDQNFATAITLGNTAVYLGNTTTSLGNVTLTNVTISSGNVTLTGANVSGTANISTLIVTGNQTSLGNVAITGNISANIVTVAAGAVGTPSITTTGDANTGIFFPAADTIAFSEGGVEAMRIDSSGNVGIGTSSPNKKLEVVSAGEIIRATSTTASNDQVISIKNDSGTTNCSTNIFFADRYAATSYASSYIRGTTSGTSVLIFATGGTNFTNIYDAGAPTERMRIDSSGNLLVGTTSSNPGIGNNNTGCMFAGGGYGSVSRGDTAWYVNYTGTGTGQNVHLKWQGTTVGNISTTSTATAYNTSSDYRLKHDIAPMAGALAKVAALKPVTYKWSTDNSDGEGFIAHELAEVCPHAVTGEKDAVDAEGNPIYQSIDTSFLVATLTAAIQEQQALIQQLQADIATLKGQK